MSVLITGSSSYIGKNLIDFLERNKVDYIGIDLTKPYTNKCIKMSILDTKIGTKIKKNYLNNTFGCNFFRSTIY